MSAATARLTARLPMRSLFVLTVFTGSFLLFLVQPMFARLALPHLGGAPAVWTVAMLFYQAALLAGYIYADILVRLRPKRQYLFHIAAFLVAAATLPVSLREIGGWQETGAMLWLIAALAISIGPVFFVISAQAPLMQSWFAAAPETAGRDPYFLYAASNAGSLLALLIYPVFIEPSLTLTDQRLLWSAGFVLLLAMVVIVGLDFQRAERPVAPAERQPIPARTALSWIALAAVPSGLMLSTTTHLTTDIVAVPLLWVLPLGLYLLSFIVAFSEGGQIFVRNARFIAPPLLLALGSYTFMAEGLFAFLLAMMGLVLLFYVALALHGQLAAARPPAGQLTGYYLYMSVGGMLGGLFAAVVAPLAFDWTYEHPILLVAAAALLPATPLTGWFGRLWEGRAALSVAVPVLALLLSAAAWQLDSETVTLVLRILFVVIALLAIGQRLVFAGIFAALMLSMGGWSTLADSFGEAYRVRSFFGIYTIREENEENVRQLQHGTTLHGAQSRNPALATRPLGYYGPTSGAGRIFASLDVPQASVGVVGLGVGSLGCYRQPGQEWTFFEIDPVVVTIARDRSRFTYLSRCAPDADIVIGDARVSLARDGRRNFDLLAIDAFSSDAIPQHLMTREAFQLYTERLKAGGRLLVHISNRFVDLEPVVGRIAEDLGWHARILDDVPERSAENGLEYTRSLWIVMAADEASLPDAAEWRPLNTRPDQPAWTDDFGSILPVLRY
ncbi:spermidine synthase [Pacificimonas sp. ICDLI1SI03]